MGEEEKDVKEKGSVTDRISLILTLVAVSVFAIFTGYLVGQYAIRWVASPLVKEVKNEPGGTRLSEGSDVAASRETAAAESSNPRASAADAPQSSAEAEGESVGTVSKSGEESSSSAQTTTPAPADSSTIHRVQIGHFTSRDEATSVSKALKSGKAAVPDAWVLFDKDHGEYRVQVGAFSSLQHAQDFAGDLQERGYDAYVTQ